MQDIKKFEKAVLSYWRINGRHTLPWRKTRDPYAILVSEVMLQQTQVDRVVPYFKRWMRRFPNPQVLAEASLTDVLKEWSGLGYNRRAKMLRECAKNIVEKHGKVPKDFAALVSLPGVGPYTAGAIRAFAFNQPDVFIETNIRSALIHHFFPRSKKVPDAKLVPILEECITHVRSVREWYSALMDYGAHIKKEYPNPSRRSKHHTRQSAFEGSLRQIRGALIHSLVKGSLTQTGLLKMGQADPQKLEEALRSLVQDTMIVKKRGKWHLAESGQKR